MQLNLRIQAVWALLLFCAASVVSAQQPNLSQRSSRRAHNVATAPAKTSRSSSYPAATLAERLKQIRARMAAEANHQQPPAQLDAKAAAPARKLQTAPGPVARVAELPKSPLPKTPGLHSVLKRRPTSTSAAKAAPARSAAPPRELIPSETQGLTELASPTKTLTTPPQQPAVDSSRRTARRLRSPGIYRPATPGRPLTGSNRAIAIQQRAPTMRVETEGPKAITVGKQAHYHVRLSNLGTETANQILVTVTLPNTVEIVSATARLGTVGRPESHSGQQQLAWQLTKVPSQSQHELEITLRPKTSQPVTLQVDWMFRATTSTANIEVQQPKLEVQLSGPTEMLFGDTKVFKVFVSNPGTGAAENVSLNISATGASTTPNQIGTLAAGETRQLELELKAGQAGVMEIRAEARGDGDLQAQATHAVRVRRAQLAVSVSAPQLLYAGTEATYQIQIANRGDATAKNVILQVDLPRGAKNGFGIDNQPLTATTAKWQIGNLPPGTRRTYSVRCTLTSPGRNPITARMQTPSGLSAADAATTQVDAIADLKLEVNDPKGPVPVGQVVTYEVQVINRGSKEAKNVTVVAQFSEGIEPTSASGQPSKIVPGQVIFDPISVLPAGGQITLKVQARASMSGNLRFRAELTCPDPDTKLVSEETTRFYGAAAQSAGTAGPGTAAAPSTANRPPLAPTPAVKR